MHNTVIASRHSGRQFALYWGFLVFIVFLWFGFIIFMSPFLFNRLTAVRQESSISPSVGDYLLLPLCCGFFENGFPSLLELYVRVNRL